MGKNRDLYQFLQENGVTAPQTIFYENKKYAQFQKLQSFFPFYC